MAGRRAECWQCNSALGWFGSRKLWLLTFVRRFLSKRVAANIMPTNWLGEQLKLPRMTTILHGLVQIDPVNRNDLRAASRASVIVFQGRLVTTKGALLLLEAARMLCERKLEFALLFIGDGPQRAELQKLAQQEPLKGRVKFAGRLAPVDLEAAIADASVVVVPSLGGEVFGLVVAENMQRGLPVIASDLGAFVEVLGEGGVTFQTGDAADLARKLAELLDDPARCAALWTAAQRRAREAFALGSMVSAHSKLYHSFSSSF